MTPDQIAWYEDRLAARVEYEHWSLAPWEARRWPNFAPFEIACRGTGRLAVDAEAMDDLQALRVRIGATLYITSGYRSDAHNRAVGGSTRSMHRLGLAFDISVIGLHPPALEAAARDIGFTGIGRYRVSRFLHVDRRPWQATWGHW